eukprot:m.79645 g.79645  ORF g.79645 m.79645 type:complete len:333 (+) comp25235_c0_seq1:159-1157(+)
MAATIIFSQFTGDAHGGAKKAQMDGRQFSKMAKDCVIKDGETAWSLLDKKFTSTDIDIIFSKVKAKGERKINVVEFTNALTEISVKKNMTFAELCERIMESGGQKFTGTKATHVKLHDDKAGYTGVSSRGGPSTVDELNVADLSVFTERTPHGPGKGLQGSPSPKKSPKQHRNVETISTSAAAESLEQVFLGFTNGAKEMDGRQLAKLTKDAKILNKKITATDVDISFAKFKSKGARKINYTQFEQVIESFALKEKITKEVLVERILAKGGPTFSGTKTQGSRLHDDKSTYTATQAHGGPTLVGRGFRGEGEVDDLSQLADRTSADVRGTKH